MMRHLFNDKLKTLYSLRKTLWRNINGTFTWIYFSWCHVPTPRNLWWGNCARERTRKQNKFLKNKTLELDWNIIKNTFFSLTRKAHKHPSRGVLWKMCSESVQRMCRRAPMPKRDFNKVVKQTFESLDLNNTCDHKKF